ncbi:MAG: hypothetical protein ACTHKT_14455, partial [Solirubrobacterales bacterium]
SSRTTPNGKVIVFESKAKLTPYENAGHTEIYRWEEEGTGVECASCQGAPEPAEHDARLQELENVRAGNLIHNLSADGTRVFFETPEALSAADTDNTNDIYEWSKGALEGPQLISSGRSTEYIPLQPNPNLPSPNLLLSITPDGNNVVFLSEDDLTGEAGIGSVPAIYDARVNGGFPPPPAAPIPCSEEGCRRPSAGFLPSFAEPKSDKAAGPGNVKPKKQKHRCHHHKGSKKHCAKHHRSHKQGRARLSAASPTAGNGSSVPSQAGAGSPAPAAPEAPGGATSQPAAAAPLSTASGEFSEFGINTVSAGLSSTAASQHADFTTYFKLNYHTSKGEPVSDARLQEATSSLPPGLLGNPNATEKCETGAFVAFGHCPIGSQVGVARVLASQIGGVPATEPIYNLQPPHPDREIARLGFFAILYPVYIDVNVRAASDYGVTATVHSAPGLASVLESETTLWGSPSDESHDPQRLTAKEALACLEGTACENGGERKLSSRNNQAFLSNPSACGPGTLGLAVTSYQLPGRLFTASASLPAITDCTGLPFAPSFSATPTTHKAGAPTGLKTTLTLPQHLGASEPATATMREARVTLPAGMGVNPEAADWIQTCSDSQVGFHREVDAACPNGSKLGTALIKSPALSEPIEGAIYQRQPTPGHQLGLWLVADALGLHIKLPGELVPDNKAGRASAVFGDLPQVPVEEIDLNVWGGPRAPLTNPASCGTYATDFSFAPHSDDPAVTGQAPMVINEGCNQPFDPKL